MATRYVRMRTERQPTHLTRAETCELSRRCERTERRCFVVIVVSILDLPSSGRMSDTRSKAWSKRRRKQESAERMREMKRMRRQTSPPPSSPPAASEQQVSSGAPLPQGDRVDPSLSSHSSPPAASDSPGAPLPPGERVDPSLSSHSSPPAASDSPGAPLPPGERVDPSLSFHSSPSAASVQQVSPGAPTSPGSSRLSPQSLAWRKKRSIRERAHHMRECKELGQSSDVDQPPRDPDFAYRSEEDAEQSSEEEFDAQEALDEWILTLRLEQRKMLAVTLMESFKTRQKMNVKEAATEAGSIVGFSEKTIRKYRNDFFSNQGSLTPHRQGKYERHCVYHDEHLNHKAAEWVRANAFSKGQPNMTAQTFCDWVNSHLLVSSHLPPFFPREVSLRTSVRWLHHLGFSPVSHKKGVYIDGHEREDVVRHRTKLLKILHDLHASHRPLPRCSDDPTRVRLEEDEEKKELLIIYHDESIFNTNEGQTWMWGESERPAILPKTKGSGIMVSDFVEEHGGFLKLLPDELERAKLQYPDIQPAARQLLEYGAEKEGYWTSERFMEQMKNAANIADVKYGATHTIVWLFDQSSCHKKFGDLALQANKILVKDGGARRVRDTVWGGQPQEMVQDDGSAKGLRTILRERGINTVTMKADDMRTVLSFHEDFATENNIVEEYLKSRGHQVYFLPKFHCELNAIERVWGQAKVYSRAYTNFTLSRLRQIVNPALDSVSVDLIRKFGRKARDYEQAYRDGHKAGKAVEDAVKLYKSHRRVFSERY